MVFLYLFLMAIVGFIVVVFFVIKRFKVFGFVYIGLLVLLIALIVGAVRLKKGFLPLPMSFRHLMHLTFSPENLYKPIVVDNFLFSENGFTRKYSLEPKYLDVYEIGILADANGVESTYKFKGKIRVEYFWKDIKLAESEITSMDQTWYVENDMRNYKRISLLKFNMPLQGKHKDDVSVKLTVLETDQELKKYNGSIKLYIGVSPSP